MKDKRSKCELFLKEHIRLIREDFISKKYQFSDESSPPVLSEKTYRFADLVSTAFVKLYSECQENKKNPDYWKEAGAGLAGLMILIGETVNRESSRIQFAAGAALIGGAGKAAYEKSKEHEARLKSAIALTSIIKNPQELEDIAISLGVSLAYRLSNIIDRLESSENGVDSLAKLISCQVARYILQNSYSFESDSVLLGMILKNAIPEKESNLYKKSYFNTIIGSDKQKIESKSLLTTSPAYDEVGTIYYKDGEDEPFKYPFQKLRNSEEASSFGYTTFLDVTKYWDTIIQEKNPNVKKLHVGSQDFENIPLKFHQDIYNCRNAVLKEKIRIDGGNVSPDTIIKLLESLHKYLSLINDVKTGSVKVSKIYPDRFMKDFSYSMHHGRTESIQTIMYAEQAILTANTILGYIFENCVAVFKRNSNATRWFDAVKVEISSLEPILKSYAELYIEYIQLEDIHKKISTLPTKDQEVIGYIQPNSSDQKFKRVELPPSKFWFFLELLDPRNLNNSSEKLLDLIGVKSDTLRTLLKIGGGVIMACAVGGVFYFLPEVLSTAGSVLGRFLFSGLTFCVTTALVNAYPKYLEYRERFVAYQQKIQHASDERLSTERVYLDKKSAFEIPSASEELNKTNPDESIFQYKLQCLKNYFENKNGFKKIQFARNLKQYEGALDEHEKIELKILLSAQYDELISSSDHKEIEQTVTHIPEEKRHDSEEVCIRSVSYGQPLLMSQYGSSANRCRPELHVNSTATTGSEFELSQVRKRQLQSKK